MDFQLEPDKTARSQERMKFHSTVILDNGYVLPSGIGR